jgi:hypothetical protein
VVRSRAGSAMSRCARWAMRAQIYGVESQTRDLRVSQPLRVESAALAERKSARARRGPGSGLEYALAPC